MEKDPEVAKLPIRKAAKNVMFLRMEGASGELPDGRKFDISTTCGVGGVSLVLCIYAKDGQSGTSGEDGGTYTIDGREMLEVLISAGVI